MKGNNNPSVSYADSGRKCNWLPTLAKNMPPAYFLNASCPLHKGAFGKLHLNHMCRNIAEIDPHLKYSLRIT